MTDTPRAVMMFAAGFGTRMGALTQTRPKPLIDVAGRPLIDHALDQVMEWGPDKTVVNLHYFSDQLRAHLANREVAFNEERDKILETGGGLRAALPLLGEGPVFTMNTDAVWKGPNGLGLLAQAWRPDDMDALLLCVPKKRALGHRGVGDFVANNIGRADRGPGEVYTGLQILRTEGLAEITDEAFSLNVLWDRMIQKKRLFTISYPGQWCDVGRPESIALAESMLESPDV